MKQIIETKARHYWQTLEERNLPPKQNWKTPEFPVSMKELGEQARANGVSRKDFIKLMGASAVILGVACRRPSEHIVPAVIQPTELVPGEAMYYSTAAPDGSGLIVKTREGRPIKIAGNPDHPLCAGGVSAYQIASIMDLYDPDRARYSSKIKDGKKKRAAEGDIIDDARKALAGGNYVLLTGPINSPTTRSLIADFLRQVPGGRHVELVQDPSGRQIVEGQKAAYGQAVLPAYRFDRADYVVSIDGDFLGSLISPTWFTAAYSKKRELRGGQKTMNRLVSFESQVSLTGSNADERHSIRPGDQAAVALALAAELIVKQGKGNQGARRALEAYQADKLAATLKHSDGLFKAGNFEKVITKIANELWENRGRSLVIGASPLTQTANSAALQAAINLLNSTLENDGKTVDHGSSIQLSTGASDAEIQTLIADLDAGRIGTVILGGANPLYHLAPSFKFADALKKAKYVLSLNDRADESTLAGNALLPSSHFLESWGDAEIVEGIYTLRQPAIRPLFATSSFEDRLIQLAGGTLGGQKTFHDYLKEKWQGIKNRAGTPGDFRTFWTSALQAGYFSPGRTGMNQVKGGRNFNTGALDAVTGPESLAANKPLEQELRLGLYYKPNMLDGSGANNSYRQELPDVVTKATWRNYVAILPDTARKLKLKQGSIVTVKTAGGSIELPVHLQPGLHHGAAVIALGFGRTAAGSIANGRGVNAAALVSAEKGRTIFSGATVTLEPTGDREVVSITQNVFRPGRNTEDKAPFAPANLPNKPFDGSSQYDRPIIRESTLVEYLKNPDKYKPDAIEYDEKAGLMPTWVKDKDIRWHMVIDLNQCTGCGACVTSCDLENNVPMVGPEQVHKGREMHWIRIDRYYSGSEENPDIAFQPMLCQHCESAPCENVCPVAATTHTHEGLNVMTYNRCIGTRYCANNCPFKVRRFNYFEYWNWWDGLDRKLKSPMNLGLNPDVAVRVRGVIEKCTFCVHRISGARQEAKARGESRIKDGVVKTACQEVCPTNAITFGDAHDSTSEVAKLKNDKRGYRVLDFLGVGPSITYLAKIRNRS